MIILSSNQPFSMCSFMNSTKFCYWHLNWYDLTEYWNSPKIYVREQNKGIHILARLCSNAPWFHIQTGALPRVQDSHELDTRSSSDLSSSATSAHGRKLPAHHHLPSSSHGTALFWGCLGRTFGPPLNKDGLRDRFCCAVLARARNT